VRLRRHTILPYTAGDLQSIDGAGDPGPREPRRTHVSHLPRSCQAISASTSSLGNSELGRGARVTREAGKRPMQADM
jgi:hypothetical protein